MTLRFNVSSKNDRLYIYDIIYITPEHFRKEKRKKKKVFFLIAYFAIETISLDLLPIPSKCSWSNQGQDLKNTVKSRGL